MEVESRLTNPESSRRTEAVVDGVHYTEMFDHLIWVSSPMYLVMSKIHGDGILINRSQTNLRCCGRHHTEDRRNIYHILECLNIRLGLSVNERTEVGSRLVDHHQHMKLITDTIHSIKHVS